MGGSQVGGAVEELDPVSDESAGARERDANGEVRVVGPAAGGERSDDAAGVIGDRDDRRRSRGRRVHLNGTRAGDVIDPSGNERVSKLVSEGISNRKVVERRHSEVGRVLAGANRINSLEQCSRCRRRELHDRPSVERDRDLGARPHGSRRVCLNRQLPARTIGTVGARYRHAKSGDRRGHGVDDDAGGGERRKGQSAGIAGEIRNRTSVE